ncbi:Coiled-coil domain-containing protein [Sesamum angolense]|uniref:Coiled-coil domain-containing protein n=1 Tax=Sesamum angolense TaxID=2727404 RepID=A0AAE1XE96_9LAMI|nr:Coiled-coil domain-containing protein [Sesamum angolense]
MSSLAAARADNFYYPPEWDPKKGGLNKFHGQHALRERARKIDQGILIIRFEMPFNIWCGGCESMIAKGVRFNAEKKQVGNYYSTKIWSFTMKSACCKHEIVIQTDPQNCEYVIISGARRKIEEYDAEDAETLVLPVDDDRSKVADPFKRLEHQEGDMKKKKEAEPVLKKRVAEEEANSRKAGLGIRLLPSSAEDAAAASRVKFAGKFERNRKDKRALIHASSIFSGSSTSSVPDKRHMELEAKRRKINAATASRLLVGGVKPSSWTRASDPTRKFNRV